MKRKMTFSLILLPLMILFLTVLTGCVRAVFAAEIIETDEITGTDPTKPDSIDVFINGHKYPCSYDISYTSVFTGAVADRYRTGERGRIVLDPEKNEIIRFYGIEPFSSDENFGKLSDNELAEEVKTRLVQITDLSIYNAFSVERFSADGKNTSAVSVKLYQENGLELNNSVAVNIDQYGMIDDYLKISGCPEGTVRPRISEDDAYVLICEAVSGKYGEDDLGEIRIKSEALTLYNGSPALLFYVEAADAKGFSIGLVPVVIFEQKGIIP